MKNKLLFCLLLLLTMLGCTCKKAHLEDTIIKVDLVLKDISCIKPQPIKLNVLDPDKYIVERDNAKKLVDNYIMMNSQNSRLETAIDCYTETFENIKEELK